MSSNINTTNNINPKFIVSSNNSTGEPALDLARKALKCITQEQIAPTEVSSAYQKVFKGGSTNTISRSQVYVLALIYKKTQGFFPESLEELVDHINEHSTEPFEFDKPKLAEQYLVEIKGDADYITEENNSTIINLGKLRELTQNKRTESKLFHSTSVTQPEINVTRPNIKVALSTLSEQIDILINAENEGTSPQINEGMISLEVCKIVEHIESDPLAQKSSDTRQKYINELSAIIKKLNNPIKFMLNLCRDTEKSPHLSHLKKNMAFLLTKSIDHAIRQIETQDDSGLVTHLSRYIEDASQFISQAAKTNLYNVLINACLKAKHPYPEGLHLPEDHISYLLERIPTKMIRENAIYLLEFLTSALKSLDNSLALEDDNNYSTIENGNNSLSLDSYNSSSAIENHNNYAIATES